VSPLGELDKMAKVQFKRAVFSLSSWLQLALWRPPPTRMDEDQRNQRKHGGNQSHNDVTGHGRVGILSLGAARLGSSGDPFCDRHPFPSADFLLRNGNAPGGCFGSAGALPRSRAVVPE
jgi:hypothetical protein